MKTLEKIWEFFKPVSVAVLAGVGYFVGGKFLYLAILITVLVLRAKTIGQGFVDIYKAVFKKN